MTTTLNQRPVQKGDFVIATKGGFGRYARGYNGIDYKKDDELVVTSVRTHGFYNVRRNGSGVFVVPRSNVMLPDRDFGIKPEDGLDVNDPRLTWIFEDAARLANRYGYCHIFDRIAEELGVPGRPRTFEIPVLSRDGVEITAKVVARSKFLAEQKVLHEIEDASGRGSLVLETSASA